MSHKIITLALGIFIHYMGYSQLSSNIYIYDKEYGIPIENAIVRLKNGVSLTSDRNGKVDISQIPLDTIRISHLSYMTFTTVIERMNRDTIFLDPRIYEMESVTVYPKRIKRIGVSTQNDKHYSKLTANGFEIAQKFKLPKTPARLLDLKFNITEIEGADSLLIKINFFTIAKGMPGAKNNDHQILFIVKQQNEMSIDLSTYNIEMHDDFILSMQIMKVFTTVSGILPYIKIPVKVDLAG
ncbi:MAG: hypothetical protein LBB85_12505, partial [Dysgonamonadaceae bacterium]|nr:hypothetical protein [Dysgonamonadaceae bacterium]